MSKVFSTRQFPVWSKGQRSQQKTSNLAHWNAVNWKLLGCRKIKIFKEKIHLNSITFVHNDRIFNEINTVIEITLKIFWNFFGFISLIQPSKKQILLSFRKCPGKIFGLSICSNRRRGLERVLFHFRIPNQREN